MKLISLVGKCEFTQDEKEKNLLRRIVEKTDPVTDPVTHKSLKNSNTVANDFIKNKEKRRTQEMGSRKYNNDRGYK